MIKSGNSYSRYKNFNTGSFIVLVWSYSKNPVFINVLFVVKLNGHLFMIFFSMIDLSRLLGKI